MKLSQSYQCGSLLARHCIKSRFHIPCKHGQQHPKVMQGGGCGLSTIFICVLYSQFVGEIKLRQ